MNIAIVGDPHIATGYRARVDDYLSTVLDKMKVIAQNNDYVVFLGDVFSVSSAPTFVFNKTYRVLKEFSGKLHTILGNHDTFHRNINALNKTTIGSLDLTQVIKVHTKPFTLEGIEFVPVMTDDDFLSIPRDDTNSKILLCHKYYEMMVCPEESLESSELVDLNYKYVFMGHDHQPYNPIDLGNTILYRPGSLTRTTVDMYNKDRDVIYYRLDTETMNVTPVKVDIKPSSEVFLKGSFDKPAETKRRIKTDGASLAKLLARFDKQQLSNLSLEGVLRRLNATEQQIAYLRELHRENNISYN